MGIHNALYSGVSGLAVNTDGMGVISNNIANANTRAFKTDRAEFEDLLSITLSENSQMGRGARLRNISTNFGQGGLSNTGQITDLGVQGDGFFMVRSLGAEIRESGGKFYTRQGSFRFDREGFLVDVNGSKLQGYMSDEEGKLSSKLSDLQIASQSVAPAPTRRVNLAVNLDVREKPAEKEFDINQAQKSSNFSSTVTIYDNHGESHNATIYFSRTKDADKNDWKFYVAVSGADLHKEPKVDALGNPLEEVIHQGSFEFDPSGKLVMPYKTRQGRGTFVDTENKSDAVQVTFSNGASAQKIQFDFGPPEEEDGSIGTQMSTSIASRSLTLYHSQNGYESGNLKSLKIDQGGSIRGVYTNGLERRLGAVALASFASNQNLQKVGRNSFISTSRSGEPRIGLAQSGTRGSIYSASLEESNVDLATAFVEMITTQRGFQANSKTITTTDSMMEEVINLKR